MTDFKNDWVTPPTDPNDEEALKEYGRQLAMDSLLSDLDTAAKNKEIMEFPSRSWNRRAWLSASAASIAGLAGFAIWKFGKGGSPPVAGLDPRWILHAAKGAEYLIKSPNHVELIRGELRFTSREPAELLVTTPHAKATAKGTDFFIGTHSSINEPTDMKTNTLTRLLVLAGSVTLANAKGAETAGPRDAIIAKPDLPPEKILVKANSKFAFDCYAQLSKENPEKNLFFSPYSISNALMMVAEGARSQTAHEIGSVLGFPEDLLRKGKKGQQIPWKIGTLRVGQSRLNQLINREENPTPEQKKLIAEEAALGKQIEALTAKAEEIKKAGDSDETHRAYDDIRLANIKLNELREKIDTTKLRVANAVWGDRTANFNEPWKNTIAESYGAGAVRNADFVNNHEAERKAINGWVEEQTEDRIKDLFPEGTIDPGTRLVLANAIYFKGDWLKPFSERATRPADFNLASGKIVRTPLMKKSKDKSARYAAFNGDGSVFDTPKMVPSNGPQPQTYPGDDGFTMMEKSYQGNTVSMIALAPRNPAGFMALEAKLNEGNLTNWIAALDQRDPHIHMPKFKMELGVSLKQTLSAMGMPSAFAPGTADFTGISDREELFIGAVVHKAFIDVNEKGTEAAAATGIAFGKGAKPPRKLIPFTPTFRADRPFIYLIRDRESGAILFLGRMINPEA